jgi:microcin C transport system substrate-binding protein
MPDLRQRLSFVLILPILFAKQRKKGKACMRRIGSIIENAFQTIIKGAVVATVTGLFAGPVLAQEPVWHGGTATVGELKYQDGFKRFDYVNPEAPKGGDLRLTAMGTFDSLNPILA